MDIYDNPAATEKLNQWTDYFKVKDVNVSGWYTYTGTFEK